MKHKGIDPYHSAPNHFASHFRPEKSSIFIRHMKCDGFHLVLVPWLFFPWSNEHNHPPGTTVLDANGVQIDLVSMNEPRLALPPGQVGVRIFDVPIGVPDVARVAGPLVIRIQEDVGYLGSRITVDLLAVSIQNLLAREILDLAVKASSLLHLAKGSAHH